MASEFKLSYTANEIDERLGRIDDAVLCTAQTLTEEQKAQARANIGVGASSGIEPAEDDIPKVFFGGALPQTKTDTIMSFRYISKTADISGYCKTKAQGNSSMSYPKKNQTVKLYKDAACTEKLKVDFKDWGKQNKFCFKANWVDLTHARNIVSARLWGDVVKSRTDYENIPELLRTSPNQGAVDGFPVKVYANGVYQGRYTINIPKDAWMANMDDELDTHCILCGENYVSGCFRAEATIDGNDWTDEVHDTVPNAIETRWNEAIRFVMNSTDDEFVAGIGNYFDIPSLIDYYCFGLVTCNMDGFGKNQLYHTYDGLKWFATVYDMDSTFGTYFSRILPYDFARTSYEDFNTSYPGRCGNLLYIRLENLFADEIKSRYIELRDSALSVDNIINRFERFTDITPNELVIEDYAETTGNGAFAGIPLQGESTIQQIRNYTVKRLEYVDTCILQLDYGLIYALPAETSFNGTSDYIDTGISLIDSHKNYAVFIDFAGAATQANTTAYWKCVAMCQREWNDINGITPGFKIQTDGNYQLFMRSGSDKTTTIYDIPGIANNTTDRQRYIIQKDITAGTVTFYYVDASGNVQIGMQYEILDADLTYSSPVDTLVLGTIKSTSGNGTIKDNFWTGTIYDCRVWNRPLTESEINTLLVYEEMKESLIYSLPAETSFNGTSDYIDTGINLLDTHKDFAVFVDFAGAATQVNTTDYWKRVVQMRRTWNDRDVHPGFEIRMDGNYQLSMRTGSDAGQTIYDIPDIANNTTDRQRYIFQKDISAGTVTFYYVDASGNVQIGRQHELLDGDATYSTPHDTLTLGAYQETLGTGEVKSGYWTGTFYDCKVWNRPLTESEINTLLINGSEGWII